MRYGENLRVQFGVLLFCKRYDLFQERNGPLSLNYIF